MATRSRTFTKSGGANNSLAQLWINAGGPPGVANIAAAIAMAESGGNASIIQKGQPYATTGWGLWQITPGNSVPSVGVDNALLNPANNARAAVAKYRSAPNGGNNFGPWTTYTSGAYLAFLGNNNSYTGGMGTPSGGPKNRPGGNTPGASDITALLLSQAQAQDSSGQTPPAQTTSWLSGIPIIGPVLSKIPGVNDIADPLGVFSGVSNAVNSVGDFLKLMAWIVNPHNIVRMVEFLAGFGFMAFGIQSALQARGERLEGFETGESAISRSGLGRVSRELASAAVTKGKGTGGGGGGGTKKLRPSTAPHKTRRTALRVRYEREQQVARRQTAQRRRGEQ